MFYVVNKFSYVCSIKYNSFDILEDNDVRQGLKKFSNWPTFPQLYAKGELIGGLDIVKVSIKLSKEERGGGRGGVAEGLEKGRQGARGGDRYLE